MIHLWEMAVYLLSYHINLLYWQEAHFWFNLNIIFKFIQLLIIGHTILIKYINVTCLFIDKLVCQFESLPCHFFFMQTAVRNNFIYHVINKSNTKNLISTCIHGELKGKKTDMFRSFIRRYHILWHTYLIKKENTYQIS